MKLRSAAVVCAIVGPLGLLVGAGSGLAASHQAHRAALVNACKLLKNSEIAAAIDEPVEKKKGGSSTTGARYCNWYGADAHLAERGVTLIAADTHAKQRFKLYKKEFKDATPVKGVGDAAASDGKVLFTRIGDGRFVFISPLYNYSGVTIDALKPLAKKALSRIH